MEKQKMKKVGKTHQGIEVVDVYECKKCRIRTLFPKDHKCSENKEVENGI